MDLIARFCLLSAAVLACISISGPAGALECRDNSIGVYAMETFQEQKGLLFQ